MKLTKKRAKILIGACEKLLVKYSVHIGKEIPINLDGLCSLCDATNELMGENHGCDMCPWYLFEGRGCLESGKKPYSEQTITTRRKRIKRWIGFLEKV